MKKKLQLIRKAEPKKTLQLIRKKTTPSGPKKRGNKYV